MFTFYTDAPRSLDLSTSESVRDMVGEIGGHGSGRHVRRVCVPMDDMPGQLDAWRAGGHWAGDRAEFMALVERGESSIVLTEMMGGR